MGMQLPSTKRGRSPLNFRRMSIVTKRLDGSRRHLARRWALVQATLCQMVHPAPFPKRGRSPSPIFGLFLLWPNGWMHQSATWYGGRPQPRRLCVRWGPRSSLPQKGAEPPPQFSAHVHCGQTAEWIKTALGTQVGLGPGHIVLDGDPAPLPKKGAEPPP